MENKFEENSTNQLSLVLSAFNDLCVSLAENFEEVNIWQELLSEFGHHFQMLIRTLPNVIQLAPSPSSAKSSAQNVDNDGGINFFSLCDIINRFLNTVYTATSRTVVIFLDDLQWADSVSLGLIHAILSEQSVPQRRASCVFFVGSYRDNEVPDGHILHGFNGMLTKFHVSLNSIGLDSGLNESDVNLLVSESLCMLPRLCRTLSEIVSRKTEGNPFFVQTFIRSLGKDIQLNIFICFHFFLFVQKESANWQRLPRTNFCPLSSVDKVYSMFLALSSFCISVFSLTINCFCKLF